MAGINSERLVAEQSRAISSFFGAEVPKPGDWLFEAEETVRKKDLFKVAPFYLPRRQLAQGVAFPGLKHPLNPLLYEQIKAGNVVEDADCLPGEWVLFDITKRPNYDNGKQMYPDTGRFREILADLRDKGEKDGILVLRNYRHVPKDSRFAVSPDEIDGSKAVVAKAVAAILGLTPEQVSTPPYAAFNYIGNLAHPEFGEVNTGEWFRDNFGFSLRLFGGVSDLGGVSFVHYWHLAVRFDNFGFRLQVSSPSKA